LGVPPSHMVGPSDRETGEAQEREVVKA
jgi:hypothetical protein